VELFNEPGEFGLTKMVGAASRKKKPGGISELSWAANNVTVTVNLRVTSSPEANGNGDSGQQGRGFKGLRLPETIVGHAAPATTVASLGPEVK
jgi:type VI secretion system protein ImpL